jgi:hypothetical protein
MHPMQPPDRQPMLKRSARDTHRQQLIASDDAPLPAGQLGDRRQQGWAV